MQQAATMPSVDEQHGMQAAAGREQLAEAAPGNMQVQRPIGSRQAAAGSIR